MLLFTSSEEKKLVSLAEYVSRMKPEQENIYYGCGESTERILALPQAEALTEKGFEILCLTDKHFKNITAEDLDLESEEEKEHTKSLAEENQSLLDAMKEALSGKVEQVGLRGSLGSHAACISTQGGLSSEMEKVLNSMPAGEKVHAKRVLELNPEHPVFQKLNLYAQVLYGQALLLEGTPLENPAEFARQVCQLIG